MKIYIALLSTVALASPLAAQTSPNPNPPESGDARGEPVRAENERTPTIVVTGTSIPDLDLLAGVSVVETRELTRDARGQIGDTLTSQPGVSSTSFAPGASRPVLRGFQGPRVRVLTDGLGTLDVSNTSTDHAVTVDPLTAESIEIFRGPAALLFGSGAIGGAVNVVDRRIPRSLPENGFRLDALGGYGTAEEDRSIGASTDLEIGQGFVAHLDGSFRKTDDREVGGFVLSESLRAEQAEFAAEEREEGNIEEAEEAEALAGLRGTLPNSATETYTAGGGLSYIDDGGSLGFSVGYYDTNYGIPARPGAGHAHGEEEGGEEEGEEEGEAPVTIDLQQFRADLRGGINIDGGFLESIRLRAGYSDYEHIEFEGAEVGTQFFNQGLEGRLELVQARRGPWHGTTGLQFSTRDFEAIGAEAFVPPNSTESLGIFSLQELDLGQVQFEIAGRFERVDVASNSVRIGLEEDSTIIAVDRRFNAYSIAGGVTYFVAPQAEIGVNLSRVERAPSAEELFSNGPHIATQAFEIGDPTLDKERSTGVELFARGDAGPIRFQAAAYYSWFDGFIYENATGGEADGLPVFVYLQEDARYYGFEAEIETRLIQSDAFDLGATLIADYVHAEVADDLPAPRIPPLRLLGELDGSSGPFNARVSVEHIFEQDRVANFETPTDGFTLVGASLGWQPFGTDDLTELVLSANNLFDVDARRHASFTKDYVPLAGRDIRLSLRLSL